MIGLRRHGAGIELSLREVGVSHITFAIRLEIVVYDPDRDYLTVIITAPFIAKHGEQAPVELDPEADDPRLGQVVFALRHKQLIDCRTSEAGSLMLAFEPPLTIEVAPDEKYQAWELQHKSFMVMCLAEGDLSITERAA
jgi:hypothetical protein